MSVAFGTPAVASNRNTSIVAAMPAGAVVGDLVRLVVLNATNATYTAPGGWTLVVADQATTGGASTNPRIAVYWRIFDGTGADAFSATLSSTATWQTQAGIVTGGDIANPVVTFAIGKSGNTATTAHTGPTLTPSRGGLLALTAGSCFAATAVTYTPDPAMSEYSDAQETGQRSVLTTDVQTVTGGAATGTRTATCSLSSLFVALMVVWADAPAAANAKARVSGAWVDKPLRCRVSGAWL